MFGSSPPAVVRRSGAPAPVRSSHAPAPVRRSGAAAPVRRSGACAACEQHMHMFVCSELSVPLLSRAPSSPPNV